MVVFAQQNVTKDPPFTKLDLVSCRNLFIYLEPELQKKLIQLFQYGLNPGGILILGSSESNSDQERLFSPVNTKLRIYKRSTSAGQSVQTGFSTPYTDIKTDQITKQLNMKVTDNLQSLTDQLLLEQFSPASVLLNDKGDILYISGHTGKYLEPATGKANMNIFAMARPGLRNELATAFHKALHSYQKMVFNNIEMTENGRTGFVNLTIQKIEKPGTLRDLIIVVFSDVPAFIEKKLLKSKKRNSSGTLPYEELKLEIERLKEESQISLEEMQTSQEELKSTNEELQSTNEELQSTNEEANDFQGRNAEP